MEWKYACTQTKALHSYKKNQEKESKAGLRKRKEGKNSRSESGCVPKDTALSYFLLLCGRVIVVTPSHSKKGHKSLGTKKWEALPTPRPPSPLFLLLFLFQQF